MREFLFAEVSTTRKFGDENATLDKVLDHYKISRSKRDHDGHGATLDARLLSKVYPKLLNDYTKFTQKRLDPVPSLKIPPPTA